MSDKGWSQWICLGALILIDSVLWAICAGLNASEIASWAQAVGAIGAVGVAIFVVRLQAKENEAYARRRASEDLASVLRAIGEEIEIYLSGVLDVKRHYSAALASNDTRQLPHTTQRFYVYEACAGQVGRLQDQDLRRLIIGMYGAIGFFFETVNQCSAMTIGYSQNQDDAQERDIRILMNFSIHKANELEQWNQSLQAKIAQATNK